MIYLDNAATTQTLPAVANSIYDVLMRHWGNPSSVHNIGLDARDIVDSARETVAKFINAEPSEIIFTSGACESNSLALRGFLDYSNFKLITTELEHKSIMNLAKYYYFTSLFISNDEEGFANLESLENRLDKYNGLYAPLVSIQMANNEIGTIQDIKSITELTHKYNKGIFHTDATQYIPYAKVDVKELGIDMMSFSGQKFGCPKGIGVLYVKDGIKLRPLIFGSQEKGLRGGTQNVAYIKGLETAIKEWQYPGPQELETVQYFYNELINAGLDIYLVGARDFDKRLGNNLSICFRGVEGEILAEILNEKEIYVSTGSACNSHVKTPSYVLQALGMNSEDVHSVIRFTFNRDITKADCDTVVKEIVKAVRILKG